MLSIALVAILALAIVGLRWQTLFSGVAKGAQQVVSNPLINNATEEGANEYFGDLAKDAISVRQALSTGNQKKD
jgi:hypothetical protein